MKTVLLSFDLEEFDLPLEYNHRINFDQQIAISQEGTKIILSVLDKFNIKATFFSTYTFASHSKSLISQIAAGGHELASHGLFHSKFSNKDFKLSKDNLEDLTGCSISGFRMPRMMPVDLSALADAGYTYDSSLNPVFIPGRYNNILKPRLLHKSYGVWQIPASATPFLRIPLFWLSFHHFPIWFYRWACNQALREGNYLNLYFHPWEFVELKNNYDLPQFLMRNSGPRMIKRFEILILSLKGQGLSFTTINDFIRRSDNKIIYS